MTNGAGAASEKKDWILETWPLAWLALNLMSVGPGLPA